MAIQLLPLLSTVGTALKLPALVGFIAQIATTLFGWFFIAKARNVTINLVILTLLVGITVVLTLAVYTLAAGLSYIAPPEWSAAAGMFIPNNAVPCISAIYTARLLRWVWEWKFYAIVRSAS
jgi:biotin transporter BioY